MSAATSEVSETPESRCGDRAMFVARCWARTICVVPVMATTLGVTAVLFAPAVVIAPFSVSVEFIATGDNRQTLGAMQTILRIPENVHEVVNSMFFS